MSGMNTFDWASSKPFEYRFDYELPEGHSMHVDAAGNISLLTAYELLWEGCLGVSAGVLWVLVEDHPERSVFVSFASHTGRLDLPVCCIDTETICGPGFAFHPVDFS